MGKYFAFLILLSTGCSSPNLPLPVLGPWQWSDGEKQYAPLVGYTVIDQYENIWTCEQLNGQVRVVDFFFTSCPSICPTVQAQMLRIREQFSPTSVQLISYTIDPKRDTPQKLLHYAQNLGFTEPSTWLFATGDKNTLFDLATEYFNVAATDESAPGGFDHTGRIVLLDKAGYIRAYAEGTNSAAVDTLILQIEQLLAE